MIARLFKKVCWNFNKMLISVFFKNKKTASAVLMPDQISKANRNDPWLHLVFTAIKGHFCSILISNVIWLSSLSFVYLSFLLHNVLNTLFFFFFSLMRIHLFFGLFSVTKGEMFFLFGSLLFLKLLSQRFYSPYNLNL